MRSFRASPANPSHPSQIHPALIRLADEFCGTLAYLFVYVGALTLLAIFGVHLWEQLPSLEVDEPAGKPGWSVASRSYPAFALSELDFPEKTITYEIFRHPEGGRPGAPRSLALWTGWYSSRPEMTRNWPNYSPTPNSGAGAALHQPRRRTG
jgi:hypothetical protein